MKPKLSSSAAAGRNNDVWPKLGTPSGHLRSVTDLTLWGGAVKALGLSNIARVATYRLGLKTGTHPVVRLRAQAAVGPFFRKPAAAAVAPATARQDWRETGLWFGAHEFPCPDPPDWHLNPFTGARTAADRTWYEIGDFDAALGDIKAVWEASRFDWLLAMAQRAALGATDELERLNLWLADWSRSNPPFFGVNWKCGQEASIRVMHLSLAALLLDQALKPEPSLIELVELHLARIGPTIGYAIGQQNNHATSEAAALFIGGSWLNRCGIASGARFARLGRRQLDAQARRLIGRDGSFSQHSLVYHRVVLDSYCLAEVWRRRFGLPRFAPETLERMSAATRWLSQLTDRGTGDGPNYGSNDGSRLMGLTEPGYRDFRPTLQCAAALFLDRRAIVQEGSWDQPLHWLGISAPIAQLEEPRSVSLDDGGLHVLRKGRAVAYLRYPRFRFRPSQADALHLDLWLDGSNVLRDAGTLSYNSIPDESGYFSGTAAHNTVQFDGRDQMPRLGRFLFGAWLKAKDVRMVASSGDAVEAAAGYRDWQGAEHHRSVRLEKNRLHCVDCVGGRARVAVLRWRLRPGEWRLEGNRLTNGELELTIESDPDPRISLRDGWQSLFYLQKSSLPVVEVEMRVPTTVETTIGFG